MIKSGKIEIGNSIVILIGILILILSNFHVIQPALTVLYPFLILIGVIVASINSIIKDKSKTGIIISNIMVIPFLIVIIFHVFFLPGYEYINLILFVVIIGFIMKMIQRRKIYLYEPIFVLEAIFRLV